MEKYRTRHDLIQKFDVVKETTQRITYKRISRNIATGTVSFIEETESRESKYQMWHNTFDEARKFLIDKKQNEIFDCKDRLQRLEKEMKTIEQIKEF